MDMRERVEAAKAELETKIKAIFDGAKAAAADARQAFASAVQGVTDDAAALAAGVDAEAEAVEQKLAAELSLHNGHGADESEPKGHADESGK